MKSAVLIPTLDPEDKLCKLIKEIQSFGVERILIVDDGSAQDKYSIFEACEKMNCTVVHHDKNYGKGAAIRTGIHALRKRFDDLDGVVTADGDGQHAPADIYRILCEVDKRQDEIILGIRDFSSKEVPFKSKIGNQFSSCFFRIANGISCPDTQTGLRGIPKKYFDFALSTEGDRYEYEMNFLCTAARNKYPLKYITIQTIYEDNNKGSHFDPIKDSLRIYAQPLRYMMASLSSFGIDILAFTVLAYFMKSRAVDAIFIATICARIISGIYNFWINRNWSFSRKDRNWTGQAIRYVALFLSQMLLSAGVVTAFSGLTVPLTVIKIIVDTCLFFVSYIIQRDWVFRK